MKCTKNCLNLNVNVMETILPTAWYDARIALSFPCFRAIVRCTMLCTLRRICRWSWRLRYVMTNGFHQASRWPCDWNHVRSGDKERPVYVSIFAASLRTVTPPPSPKLHSYRLLCICSTKRNTTCCTPNLQQIERLHRVRRKWTYSLPWMTLTNLNVFLLFSAHIENLYSPQMVELRNNK